MAIAFAREAHGRCQPALVGLSYQLEALRFDSNHRTQNKDIGDRC